MFGKILYMLSKDRRKKADKAYKLMFECFSCLSVNCVNRNSVTKRDLILVPRIKKLVSIYMKLTGSKEWLGHDWKTR